MFISMCDITVPMSQYNSPLYTFLGTLCAKILNKFISVFHYKEDICQKLYSTLRQVQLQAIKEKLEKSYKF